MSSPGQTWVDFASRVLRFDDGVDSPQVPTKVELNVRDFLARPNGITDNQPAFQAAHDALPEWGGRIIVPRGGLPYMVESDTTISKSNVEIVLEPGAHIKADPSSGVGAPFYFKNETPTSFDDLTVDPSAGDISITVTTPANFAVGDWITIKDNELTGLGSGTHWEKNRVRSIAGSVLTLEYPLVDSYATLTAVAPSAAVFAPVVNSGIRGAGLIENGDPADGSLGNSGVFFSHAVGGYCKGVEVFHCRTDAIRVFDSYMCEVSNNYIHDSTQFDGNGRGITPTRSTHVLVQNNRLARLRHQIDVSNFSRHVLVQGNVCRGGGETMLFTHPNCKWVWFVDNDVDGGYGFTAGNDADWGTTTQAGGMGTREDCQYILFEGNKVANVRANGINIHGDNNNDIIVKNNYFTNCNLASSTLLTAAITAVQTLTSWTPGTGIIIEGNEIYDTTGRGIVVGFSGAVVKGNHIRGIVDNSGDTCGILVRPYTISGTPAAISDIVVEDNTIDDVEGYGIRVGQDSTYLVTDTTVIGNHIRETDLSAIHALPVTVDGLTIEKNHIRNPNKDVSVAHAGIAVGSNGVTDVDSTDLLILDNTIHCGTSTRGIMCSVTDAKIVGNKIFNSASFGIYLACGASGQDSQDILVAHNTIVGCVYGMYVGDNSAVGDMTRPLLVRNIVTGGTNGIRVNALTTDCILLGNVIYNNSGDDLNDNGSTTLRVMSYPDVEDYRTGLGLELATRAVDIAADLKVGTTLEVDGALDHDGSTVGLFGVTPAVRPAAYTVTNGSTDRTYNADSTTLHELADVLGTLIADLKTLGILQ